MSSPRYLLDRSLGGRKLVTALREAEWNVITLGEQFGDPRAQRMGDEEWITEGTAAGFVLLTKDHRIASNALLARAIHMNDARVIALARGDITADEMASLCLAYAKPIHRIATVHPPFVFSLSQHGLRRKHLNWPAK